MGNDYSSVFTPGGIPTITYNPRESHDLERRIRLAKENICKVIIVTGQTKIGKTVLVDKVFSHNESVWINGGTVTDEESFWEYITSSMEIPTESEETISKETAVGFEVGVEGQVNLVVLKATPNGNFTLSRLDGKEVATKKTKSNKIAALQYLSNTKKPLIIDDFHYIARDIQTAIIRALKSPIMYGLPVILIAIPNRKFDVIKVEREMTGRIDLFEIPEWSVGELKEIAVKGFEALNVHIHTNKNLRFSC